MSLNNPITEPFIPPLIARDAEYIAADKAHVDAADPHLQYATQARGDARYVRYLNSFAETIPGPIKLTANTWQDLGSARIVGERGKGAMWDVGVYLEYTDTLGGPNYNYYQYFGAGKIGVIFWQADFLTNLGVQIPFETHNEADFTASIRFGEGQLRKLQINPSRLIDIAAPGFVRITGVRNSLVY
jgi:hypothetical protein